MRPVITWQRITEFQLVTLAKIAAAVLYATPGYCKEDEAPEVYVPGDISLRAFAFRKQVVLHVSRHNPGAQELAKELENHCGRWAKTSKKKAKSPLEIVSGRAEQQSAEVAGVPVPIIEDGSERLSPRSFIARGPSLRSLGGRDVSWGALMTGGGLSQNRRGSPFQPNTTHMLLYLNQNTFVGEAGQKLAEEVRWALGLFHIVIVHEQDLERDGCGFDRLLHSTPEDLISLGLYRKAATACLPQPLRSVSLALIAKALGAVPVEPLIKQIVRQASMFVRGSMQVRSDSYRRSMARNSMARNSNARQPTRTATLSRHLSSLPSAAPRHASERGMCVTPTIESTPSSVAGPRPAINQSALSRAQSSRAQSSRAQSSRAQSSRTMSFADERQPPLARPSVGGGGGITSHNQAHGDEQAQLEADEEAQLAWAMRESMEEVEAQAPAVAAVRFMHRHESSGSCLAMKI